MKWYILGYVLAGLNVFTALYQLFQNVERWYSSLGSAIFWGIVGYILQARYQRKMEEKSQPAAVPQQPVQRYIPPRERYAEKYVCKVTGVTYKNDDGSSRQAILKELYNDYGASDICILDKFTYEGAPAFYVQCCLGVVGTVPANCVANVIDIIHQPNLCMVYTNQFEDDEGNEKYWAELNIYYGEK